MRRTIRHLLVMLALVLTVPTAPFAKEPYDLAGLYAVDGQNPNGKPYSGTVEIVAKGETYMLHWILPTATGDEESYGVGFISHGQLVVAAGAPTPMGVMITSVVAYRLEKGMPTKGQWASPVSPGIYAETLKKLPKGHPVPTPQQQRTQPDKSKELSL